MSGTGAHLTLRPDRCNGCGACVAACPNDAVRVGESYILIDWKACDQCCACVDACQRGAIVRAAVTSRTHASMPAVSLGDVSKVVVGSRAEAKAVRKAAEQAAKQAGKVSKSAGKAAPAAARSNVVPLPVASVAAGSSARPAMAASTPARRAEAFGSTKSAAVVHEAPQFGEVTWSMVDVGVVLGLLLATLLGKNALLALPAVALMPEAGRAVVRGVVLACFYAVQFGGLAFLAARRGLGLADAFGLGRRSRDAERTSALGSAGLVLLLLAGTELVSITYGLAMQAAGWKQPLALSTDLGAVFGGGIAGLVASVVLVALVAPLAEELAFRGVLLPAFGGVWGMWPAIVVSAALYGAYHLNLWLLFPTMVLGAALGWLAWTRRSLWPAIVLHALYNAVAVAAAFLLTR